MEVFATVYASHECVSHHHYLVLHCSEIFPSVSVGVNIILCMQSSLWMMKSCPTCWSLWTDKPDLLSLYVLFSQLFVYSCSSEYSVCFIMVTINLQSFWSLVLPSRAVWVSAKAVQMWDSMFHFCQKGMSRLSEYFRSQPQLHMLQLLHNVLKNGNSFHLIEPNAWY